MFPYWPAEIMEWLDPQPGQIIVDGTLGGGGHTRLIAERVAASRQWFCACASIAIRAAIAAAEQNLAGLAGENRAGGFLRAAAMCSMN